VPGQPRDRDYRPDRERRWPWRQSPNYFAGSNKVTVVKQHDLEPREFSFANVPLSGAGCQHFEPNALTTALHAVIDTRRITCVSAWPHICLRSSSFLGSPRNWPAPDAGRQNRIAVGQVLRGEPFHAGHRDDAGGDAV
jgi:hypothetical protein